MSEDTININIGKNAPDGLKELILSALPEASEINVVDHSEPDEPPHPEIEDSWLDCESLEGRKLRGDLLKHYSTGDPTAFVRYDHFDGNDGVSETGLYMCDSLELSHCHKPMEVRILAGVPRADALRMLTDIIDGLNRISDSVYTEVSRLSCHRLEGHKYTSEKPPF